MSASRWSYLFFLHFPFSAGAESDSDSDSILSAKIGRGTKRTIKKEKMWSSASMPVYTYMRKIFFGYKLFFFILFVLRVEVIVHIPPPPPCLWNCSGINFFFLNPLSGEKGEDEQDWEAGPSLEEGEPDLVDLTADAKGRCTFGSSSLDEGVSVTHARSTCEKERRSFHTSEDGKTTKNVQKKKKTVTCHQTSEWLNIPFFFILFCPLKRGFF